MTERRNDDRVLKACKGPVAGQRLCEHGHPRPHLLCPDWMKPKPRGDVGVPKLNPTDVDGGAFFAFANVTVRQSSASEDLLSG